MKWYLEFLLFWIVILILTFYWRLSYSEEPIITVIVSVVASLLVTGLVYSGYVEGKKRIKLKNASFEEKAEILKKERKTNRLMYRIILVLVIICIIIVVITMLIELIL